MDWQGVQPCSDGRKTGRWEDYKIFQPYSPGRSMVHTQDLDRTLWEKFSPSTNEKMNQICHQMVNRQQTICEPRKENPQLTYNVTNILGPNTALNYKTYHMLNQAEKRTACISRAMIHNGFDTRLKMYFSWTPQRDRPLSFPCSMRNTTAIYYSITQIFFFNPLGNQHIQHYQHSFLFCRYQKQGKCLITIFIVNTQHSACHTASNHQIFAE